MCLPVMSYMSMNVDKTHISESLVAHVSFGKALLFPARSAESENTRIPVLNNCPIGCCSTEKLIQDSVSQFCRNEIPQKALFLRCSSIVHTASMIVCIL